MARGQAGGSRLLWIGVAIFTLGVVVAVFGGEDLRMLGLGIEVAGAATLALNAARSRSEARSGEEDEGP